MAHSSLQICMDTCDWLQGTMSEEISTGLDSSLSSPPGGLTCSSGAGPALMERRLRPPHDLNLKCPRCDSSHTKFCYYNNYSLSQPRYFCKACRRYWTKGGTLRSIPVGGGCRKNKKSSSKKPNTDQHHPGISQGGVTTGDGAGFSSGFGFGLGSSNPNDLHLSFPQVQFPFHLVNLIGAQMSLGGGVNFMENGWVRPIDFMENKYEGIVGGNNKLGLDFMGGKDTNGSNEFGVIGEVNNNNNNNNSNIGGYNGLTSNFGGINISSSTSSYNNNIQDHIIHDGNLGINFMDQRLLLSYDGSGNNINENGVNVKPNQS